MAKAKDDKKLTRKDEYTIVLVGCGGTGGLLARELARYIYSKKGNVNKSFSLALVDADRVAQHNVARQPFTLEDVGQFKVDCLSEAFSCLYDIEAHPVPRYIDTVEDMTHVVDAFRPQTLSSYNSEVHRHIIIIGGVDNHRARQVFHEYFEGATVDERHHMYYIDSANEFDFGTVVCGYRDHEGEHCPPRAFFFPDVLTDRGKKASEIGCGEINVSAPQHLATNLLAANITFSRFVNYIENNGTAFGVTSFYPFDCSVVHRNADSYGITDYLSKWKEHREKMEKSAGENK